MKKTLQVVSLSCLFAGSASASQPALTIYNQDFAVVRDTVIYPPWAADLSGAG